jgi:hypothetical protein
MKRFLTIVGIFAGIHFIVSCVLLVWASRAPLSEQTVNVLGHTLYPIELPLATPKEFPEGIFLQIIVNAALWGVALSSLICAPRLLFKKRSAQP